MIRMENLGKRFDGKWAARELNLDIADGELFCFLGPNGAGKTTTIKLLTGLLKPTTGRAIVAGYDIQANPVEAKARVGYIPDQPYVYEKLSGRDFYHFVGDIFRVPRAVQDQRMEETFHLLMLDEAYDQFVENYSHGMRQKLVFSVALMRDPQVLIIDEPMVGLDPRSARTIKRLLREQTSRGATVFLSTHTLSVAEELADRIGIIDQGRIIFLGTMNELRQATRSQSGSLEDLFLSLTLSEGERRAE